MVERRKTSVEVTLKASVDKLGIWDISSASSSWLGKKIRQRGATTPRLPLSPIIPSFVPNYNGYSQATTKIIAKIGDKGKRI